MMNDVLGQTPKIITHAQIRSALSFNNLIAALEQGFRDFFERRTVVAPITNIDMHEFNGEMHIKPGYIVGGNSVCVKIATCYYNNPSIGLPTRDGIIVLANARTGRIATLLCDSGLITDMRTAGASAVAVRALSKEQPISLGLVGAGAQAYWHATAIPFVREVTEVLVWARRTERAKDMAMRIGYELHLNCRQTSIGAVAGCDVIVTTTPAREPVLAHVRLRPGALIVAMGADAIGKRELSPDILEQVSLLVADSKQQCEKVGELQWVTGQAYSFRVEELGAILSGASTGRQHSDEVVVFDSTGVGFQDVIGAHEVLRKLQIEVNDESD